ncbi:DUF6255 family natural product biosynthesis protein [Streptomyces olivoverticillatus]|uniref:DUF6255 family natural product biosynthesis protein n=1 Tax=Streptomyces olivoverticillatus TaxID=66427 RepID=UPI001C8782D4
MTGCPHRWTRNGGEAQCDGCGTRRFSSYAAVRPPGLPVVVTPSVAARRAADRRAAMVISRTGRWGRRWP